MELRELHAKVEQIQDKVIAWRRQLHANPELSFQEIKTAQFVHDTLQSFGNLEVSRPTKTSVMARLIGGKPGKVLALRADMDALPLREENAVGYASNNAGVMHACGHDGHTAMLLGTACIFSGMKEELEGEVRFFFQHAEELFPGGAKEMVEAGVMNGVDYVLGAHVFPGLEKGKVSVGRGIRCAAPDTFEITIIGKGGHAAHPETSVDPIAIGAQVVSNLQHIVARQIDALDNVVISITQFHAGTADNIIPDEVKMCGTVRSFDPKLREYAPQAMERIIKGITEAHRASYMFKYQDGYDPLINDAEVATILERAACELFGDTVLETMKPSMGGEDFSAFLQKAPGAFFRVGVGEPNQDNYPLHHSRFDFDEKALSVGIKLFVHAKSKLN
ncbi:N-acyl-L-amino acid amidohydrolase [Anaerosporomusa subterranea]|uniref:N-acyl-L-amino acid amidohydrolase n=1 Tax=Anaerosporomusa subterranea TaxID=1794912 RepID=A0A154BQI3_ANASB|nr:amidohydrolase [Anaerosporomusa subterranea]KYZ76115.1 N-acyl-L-amino acid amidohydrolase [Anaerosporomusa subterranea]